MQLNKNELAQQLMSISYDNIKTNVLESGMIEFKKISEAKWLLGKVKVSFEAVASLDEQQHSVTYWEQIKESSFGLVWGLKKESFKINGKELSGSISNTLPSGESVSQDCGSVREAVKYIAEKAGWSFKVTLKKPK